MSLYYKIRQLYIFIVRFCYYGYHGAKHTADYDANCVHSLIQAHMVRVNRFMHSPKQTHLVWNSNSDNKDMRLLREFTELSKRFSAEGVGYNMSKLFDKYQDSPRESLDRLNDPEFRKESKIASNKDQLVRKGLEDRYWYLLRYKVPGFWD